MIHTLNHASIKSRLNLFTFIHNRSVKGPVIEVVASNSESARTKLENHVTNAGEWNIATPSQIEAISLAKRIAKRERHHVQVSA